MATHSWHPALGLAPEFAFYGALHAASVALCSRAPSTAWRRLVFVVAAALLSLLTVRIGFYALRFAATAFPAVGRVGGSLAIVMVSSFLGALAYGILIRAVLNYRFTSNALAMTASACALATGAAMLVCRRFEAPAGLWLAIPWWFAFSGGLWWADGHSRRP